MLQPLRFLLIFALFALPQQAGPYRGKIGKDGKALVRFAETFDAMPKCVVGPDRVKIESWSRELVSVQGPIGAKFEVTCWQSSR